jgi:penicillin-binding protein 1C
VRISLGNPARTLPGKAWEAALALRLELALSKDEILASYAASAPFGGNTVGLEAAAWRYFGRPPDELSWAEAATLAVLPNNPAAVHPGRGRERLRDRRDALLRDLTATGELSASDLAGALAEPLPEAPAPLPRHAPHLALHARGERVATTIDGSLQRRAQEAVDRHVEGWRGNGVHNAAVLVAELDSGATRAYVGNTTGGARADHGEAVDVIVARRSTGSVLKPFLYASMLEAGELLPHQLVPDVPTRFGGFAPENFDRTYEGAIPASEALSRSRNVPAVWMLRDHTVDRFARRLRALGLSTVDRPAAEYGLSLIVGGAEATLWELAGAYRDLALSAASEDGTVPAALGWRDQAGARRKATFDAGAAWLTLQALVEVNRPGVDAAWTSFAGARRIAWKTGTSFGFRDAWAIGVSGSHVVGVWVGNADGEGRTGLTGTQAAAPLMLEVFGMLPADGAPRPPEASLVAVDVCAESGFAAGSDCEHRTTEFAPRSAPAGAACPYCRPIHTDPTGATRVTAACQPLDAIRTEGRFVLPAGMEAYYARRHATYRALPPVRAGCETEGAPSPLAVLSPAVDATVYVPTEVDGRRGRVVFQASNRDPRAVVYWHLDGAFLASTTAPHEMALDPAPGEHRLVLVDGTGARVERRFTVAG